MSAAMDHLLLNLIPDILRSDLLREMVERQHHEIAGHLGMTTADLFLPPPPETNVWQLQAIARVQARWLATVLGQPTPYHGSPLLASAPHATADEPPA